jgi:hypothetical protein
MSDNERFDLALIVLLLIAACSTFTGSVELGLGAIAAVVALLTGNPLGPLK